MLGILRTSASRRSCTKSYATFAARSTQVPSLQIIPRHTCRTIPVTWIATRSLSLRSNTSVPAEATVNAPIPPPEVTTQTSAVSTVAENAVAVTDTSLPATVLSPEALNLSLQYGDLAAMGLTNYTVPGVFRMLLQFMHISGGIPWFWTIFAGGVIARFITFPLVITAQKQAAILRTVGPEFEAAKAKLDEAKKRRDVLIMKGAATEMQKIMRDSGARPGLQFVATFVPATWGICTFYGVYKLCWDANLLRDSGFFLIPDLTAPAGIPMSIVLAGTIYLQMRFSMRDSYNPMMADTWMARMNTASTILPLVTIVMTPLIGLKSGIGIFMIATGFAMGLQSTILRNPVVRQRLGMAQAANIPIWPGWATIKKDISSVINDLWGWAPFGLGETAVTAPKKKAKRKNSKKA